MSKNASRQLVYMEDEQGFSASPVLFRSNCRWSVDKLAKLTEEAEHAGRISVPYSAFAKLLRKRGFTCEIIERYQSGTAAPAGFEQVFGAKGNY